MFSPERYNLSKLIESVKKIKSDINSKKFPAIIPALANNFISVLKPAYDSDWAICELDNYQEATSTVIDTILPQKAGYNFSFDLNVSEFQLPYLDFNVITKTVPEQSVAGVGLYTFSSLQELSIQLYDWQGTTQLTAPGGVDAWWQNEFEPYPSSPPFPLNDPEPIIINAFGSLPLPESAYNLQTSWNHITATSLGTGLGPFPLSEDGTQLWTGGGWIYLNAWIASLFVTYHPGSHIINFRVTQITRDTFRIGATDFPVPIGDKPNFVLPYGTTINPETHSNEDFSNQYWTVEGIVDFQGYYTTVGDYDVAKAVFTEFYPNVLITDEEDGPPWYAYKIVETEMVKSGNRQIFISKLDNNRYHFNIVGNFLLLSNANTETNWSDPFFPTYEPKGEDLFARLKVYYRSPHRNNTIRKYN